MEKIKINKIGISLVGAIFLLTFLIVLSSNVSGVSTFSSSTSWKYSSSTPFYSPGSYSSFSQGRASMYWPSLYSWEDCKDTTDFLMQVMPGGCTPTVVRSDLLEDQPVPIFCKVELIKLNPLIDVEMLKSVRFTGDSGKYISGIYFHPNREAQYSQRAYLDQPLINDAGNVVIILKRIEKEEDIPDSVKINLTGVLRYDSEGFFGAGENAYYLEPVNDEDWQLGDRYKEDSFFRGRGYLKADWVEANQAKISVYWDKDTKLGSFILEKGETSGVTNIPGFYCRGGMKVRLDDVQAGVKKAKLRVEENIISVVEGESFLEGECKVLRIDAGDEYGQVRRNDNRNITRKSVQIRCGSVTQTLSYEEKIGDKDDKESEEKKDSKIDDLSEKVFGTTKQYAEDLDAYYKGIGTETGEIWAAKALYLTASLARQLEKNKTAVELYSKVISDYSDSAYGRNAEADLMSGDMPSLSYESSFIQLIEIEKPPKEKASADITVDGKLDEGVQEGQLFGGEKFKLLKLYPDKVYLEAYDKKNPTGRFYLSYAEGAIKKFNTAIDLKEIHLEEIAKVSVIAEMPNKYSEADFSVEIGIEKRAIELSPEKTEEKIRNLNESIEKWENIVENMGNVIKGMKATCFATSAFLIVKNLFSNLGGGSTARQEVMPMWYDECRRISGTDENAFNACLKEREDDIEKDIKEYGDKVETLNKEITALQESNMYPGTDVVNRGATADALRGKYFTEDLTYTSYDYDDEGNLQTKEETIGKVSLEKASLTDLRDLRLAQTVLGSDSSNATKRAASSKIDGIKARLEKEELDKELYKGEGNNWLRLVRPKFYLRGQNKGLVYTTPIPGRYGKGENESTGFYAVVSEGIGGRDSGYLESGDIREFWIQNIGNDGVMDIYDDKKVLINLNNYERGSMDPWDLSTREFSRLVDSAIQAIKVSNRNYGRTRFSLLGEEVTVDMSGEVDKQRCQDFMSPSDCHLLFNVCDPVLCPSSRCDLGGSYRVDNVIQSGIIGSIALCLPNAKEGIYVPVCLSGIHAGLDAYTSILRNHRDCLQESLETGKHVGICDQIYSIYLCDFFWRQISPFMDMIVMKMIETAQGQGMKGGGEYLTIQDAWEEAESAVNYFKNDYAVNSFNAFNVRSMDDVGTEFCKMFASANYPTNKDFFDNLIEPDSPEQFYASFDEVSLTEATIPATSHYKVFYHIWAGRDVGANYQVYLKDPSASAYVHVLDTVLVDSGFVAKGSYASETRDFTAPSGYKQLCVRINGKDWCGFKRVSSDYAVDYVSDKYYEEQLSNVDIRSEEECISGGASSYSLTQLNVQAGVQGVISPELEKEGVVRVCSTDNPGKSSEPQKWKEVGYCNEEAGIKCWLDAGSVEDVVKNKNLTQQVINYGNVSGSIDEILLDETAIGETLKEAKNTIEEIEEKLGKITDNDAKRKEIEKIFGNEAEAIKKSIGEIEKSGNSNVVKAEAVYIKFRVYYVLARELALIKKQIKPDPESPESTPPETESTPPTTSGIAEEFHISELKPEEMIEDESGNRYEVMTVKHSGEGYKVALKDPEDPKDTVVISVSEDGPLSEEGYVLVA